MCKTWDAILPVKMQKKCMESVSSTLDLDLSCFHSVCEGILSRLRLGLKITFSAK